ncbi:uncharacterized protein LOC142522488 isoform X2 [Primulina tabacum]|uniref:uncharacterized protein LOC142522488 isoform X2 n=1 Tax=Primulina tabacum TaxID=48773 RepID=UPI003F5A67D2
MAIIRIPLSSSFGCLLSPIGSSSSSSRFSSNSVAFRARRISCNCSCFEAVAIALSLESYCEFNTTSMGKFSLDKGLGDRIVIILGVYY